MDFGFSDNHHTGNNVDENDEDDQLFAADFDYTEVVESPFSENQYENFVGDTEELDIPNFVGDLRALMVEDSEDELVVSDSDDDMIAEPKLRKTRGTLWRRVSVVGSQSTEVRSSAGSNLTDKVTDNDPTYVHAETKLQEVPTERSRELSLTSNNENTAQDEHDAKSSHDAKNSKQDESLYEPQEHTERSRELSLTSNNENTAQDDHDAKSSHDAKNSKQDESLYEPQEPTERSREMSRILDNENTAKVDQDTRSSKQDEHVDESKELTERSREMSRFLNNENTAQVDQVANGSKQDEPVDKIQEPTERSREMSPTSDDENVAEVDQDTDSLKGDENVYESQTPGELSQANALNFVDQYLSVSFENSSPEVKIPKVDGMRSPLASCAKGSHDMAKKANLMTKIGISTFDFNDSQSDHNGEPFLKKQKELDNQREKHLDGRCKDAVSFKRKLSEQFEETLPQPPFVSGDHQDPHGMFDVGFETQMAAEAMEALLCAPPPSFHANEQCSLPSRANCNSQAGAMSLKQKSFTNQNHQMSTSFHRHEKNHKELNTESLSTKRATKRRSSNDKCKKIHDKSLKVFTRKKQKEDSEKENVRGGYRKQYSLRQRHQNVETFSPVASRTRCGSSVKRTRETEDACNLEYITHGKQADFIPKRKMSDLDTNLETTFDHLKFNTWNWPKKKRTRLNMRLNAKINSVVGTDVGPAETEGNFEEALFMSSVKRKARSASKYRPMACKFGQPTLADVTNTKCVSASILLADEEKIIDSFSDGKSNKQPMKKNSASPPLKNELTRLGYAESSPGLIPKHSRRRISKTEIRVMFSQNLDDDVVKQQKKIMRILGTSMAKDCSDATHFVADRFARTKKMLQAMALGKLVVTPLWLESCEQAMCIIVEEKYILRDEKKEKEIGFNMSVSLSHARSHPLLKDRRVLITANVEPDKEMIVNLVKAVHGQVVEGVQIADLEYNVLDDLLILSCKQDYAACVPFLDKDAAVYSSELLLNGIIIQKLEYARHQLFSDHVKMKRYARQRKKNGSQHLLGC